MSFFLLPQEQIYNKILVAYKEGKQCSSYEKELSEHQFLGDIIKNELKFMKQPFLGYTINKNDEKQFFLMKEDLGFNLQGLFSMKRARKNKLFNYSVDILGPGWNYYKANTIYHGIQICRNIIVQHSYLKQSPICLKMDPLKRQLRLQLPLYLNQNWSTLQMNHKSNQVINLIVNTILKPHLNMINASLRNILILDGRSTSRELLFQRLNKNLETINSYRLWSNISTHISCHPQFQELYSLRNHQNKIESVKNLNQNKVKLQPFLFKNAQLYSLGNKDTCQQNLGDEMWKTQLQKLMKNKMAIPLPQYSELPQQNFMIENKVQIQNLKDLESERIKKGGFAHIYLTKVNYSYPYLSDGFTQNKTIKMLSQVMVLKMELPSRDLFQNDNEIIQKSKRQHELSIISKLKKGKSIYIPKYYIPCNLHKQKVSILKQSILMEHIPFRTLAQVFQQNSFCLSLHSKVGLMFSISQGLRYLRDFGIVHLDLKPHNIMTYYKSYIKLIDFRQSYHHEICDEFYQPGYTIPYSAPEIFTDDKKLYTSKTDVFSFGVIFYQMLFNKFPYDIYKSTSKLDHQMQHYLQCWYYSSQEGESYGEGVVLRILVGLISKCLSIKAEDRPQLDSIALILKLVLQVIN